MLLFLPVFQGCFGPLNELVPVVVRYLPYAYTKKVQDLFQRKFFFFYFQYALDQHRCAECLREVPILQTVCRVKMLSAHIQVSRAVYAKVNYLAGSFFVADSYVMRGKP